jgi:hypothetical protein
VRTLHSAREAVPFLSIQTADCHTVGSYITFSIPKQTEGPALQQRTSHGRTVSGVQVCQSDRYDNYYHTLPDFFHRDLSNVQSATTTDDQKSHAGCSSRETMCLAPVTTAGAICNDTLYRSYNNARRRELVVMFVDTRRFVVGGIATPLPDTLFDPVDFVTPIAFAQVNRMRRGVRRG